MAHKRVNKNMVAFLTVMGIVLTVTVVAVATYQNKSKDPEVYARAARDLQKNGDPTRAIERFIKAYGVNNEAKYLVDAARCAYRIGKIGGSGAIGMLKQAETQSPRDTDVLEQLLRYYWDLTEYYRNQKAANPLWPEIRKYSERLLELDADNVEALVYRSAALEHLVVEDPRNESLGDEAMARAVELAPNNPLVALARAQDAIAAATSAAQRAADRNVRVPEDSTVKEHLLKALEILQTAARENPTNVKLVSGAASLLATLERYDEAVSLLRDGIARMPDNADLRFELGRSLAGAVQRRQADSASAGDTAALEKEAKETLRRAVEIEPALFDAYNFLAFLEWRDVDATADPQEDLIRRGEASLTILEDAVAGSVELKSARAALNANGRAMLHLEGFETALRYATQLDDPQRKSAVMDRARAIYEQSRASFAEWHVTDYMEGQLQRLSHDRRAAIQSFERADQKMGGRWILAREQLATLYREDQQFGLALSTLESVIDLYIKQNRDVPLQHYINKAALLAKLNRPQEALHLVEDQLRGHPDDQRLLQIKATALDGLGRSDEARRLLAGTAGQGDPLMFSSALLAASEGDYAAAESTIRALLAKNPENTDAIRQLVRVLMADGRREDARKAVAELQEKVTNEGVRHLLAAYDVVLSTEDGAERDARLLELIQAIPDKFTRLSELYNFYVAENRRDLDKAAQYLTQLIELKPGTSDLIDKLFSVAVLREDYAAAEELAVKLAAANADYCGGAMYRGRLELARGNPEAGVSELRSAEQARPSDSFLKTLIAEALLASEGNHLEEALETLNQAIEINPLNFQAHALLFSVYQRLGQRDAAIEHLLAASKLNPNDPFIQANKQVVDEEDDPRTGITRRLKRREAQPDDIPNLLRLGELYVKTQDTVRAEECFTAAAKRAPDDWIAVQTAAGFFGGTGRREDAERVLRDYEARAEGVDKVSVYFALARLAEQLKDRKAAYDRLGEARQLAGEVKDPQKRREALVEANFRFAEFCSRHRLSNEMIESYRTALGQLKPSEVALRQRAMLRIIDAYLANRRLGEAEKEIAAFAKEFPDETRGLISQGELLVRRGKFAEAVKIFTQVIARVPDANQQMNAYAHYRRGSLYHDLGNFAAAKVDLLAAKRSKPNAFGLKHRLALARVYEAAHEYELAAAELRELVGLAKDYRIPADRLINLYRRTGQFEKAQQLAREYMNKYPERAFWPFALGSMLMARGEFSTAVEPLQRALELGLQKNRSSAPQMYWQLLNALIRANRMGEAIGVYEKVEPDLISPSVRACGGEAYYLNGQMDRAMAVFEQAIDEGTQAGWAELSQVARVCDYCMKDDVVVPLFKRLASERAATPNAAAYSIAYAKILMLHEKHAEALAVIKPVVETMAVDAPLRGPAVQILAAASEDDPAAQQRVYQMMLEENPDNVVAMNNLAYLMSEKFNRPKEALKYAERAHELAPRDPNIMDTLGWVRFLNGDAEAAQRVLIEATQLQPDLVAARYHLGRVYAGRGSKAQARREYERALKDARRTRDTKYEKLIDEAMSQLP